ALSILLSAEMMDMVLTGGEISQTTWMVWVMECLAVPVLCLLGVIRPGQITREAVLLPVVYAVIAGSRSALLHLYTDGCFHWFGKAVGASAQFFAEHQPGLDIQFGLGSWCCVWFVLCLLMQSGAIRLNKKIKRILWVVVLAGIAALAIGMYFAAKQLLMENRIPAEIYAYAQGMFVRWPLVYGVQLLALAVLAVQVGRGRIGIVRLLLFPVITVLAAAGGMLLNVTVFRVNGLITAAVFGWLMGIALIAIPAPKRRVKTIPAAKEK
ncbi:MAG: hypothetical protein IJY28_08590, partial [Clostridia bacterium]|nr:hypothetical protein [Clostridia bacterium]